MLRVYRVAWKHHHPPPAIAVRDLKATRPRYWQSVVGLLPSPHHYGVEITTKLPLLLLSYTTAAGAACWHFLPACSSRKVGWWVIAEMGLTHWMMDPVPEPWLHTPHHQQIFCRLDQEIQIQFIQLCCSIITVNSDLLCLLIELFPDLIQHKIRAEIQFCQTH